MPKVKASAVMPDSQVASGLELPTMSEEPSVITSMSVCYAASALALCAVQTPSPAAAAPYDTLDGQHPIVMGHHGASG